MVAFFDKKNKSSLPGLTDTHTFKSIAATISKFFNIIICTYLDVDSLRNDPLIFSDYYTNAFNPNYKNKNTSLGDNLNWEFILPKK